MTRYNTKNKKKDNRRRNTMTDDLKSTDGSAVGMTLELEDMTAPLDGSFTDDSLAAKDSLALDEGVEKDEIVLEHALPDVAGKERRRRRGMMVVAGCVLIGIIALTALLAKPESSDGDVPTHDETEVDLAKSDNVFDNDPPPPPEYYVLAPLVSDPDLLFNPNTPEGDAFDVIAQEGLTTDLDVVQRYALNVMFFSTEGGGWTNFEGWSSRNHVCDGWVGVTCQNLLVTGINLDGNNLKGTIPEDFCLLTDLKKIILSSNKQLELPSCFDKLQNLEELNLRGDNLSGELPINLHGLPRLVELDLGSNQLTGPIDAIFPDLINGQNLFPNLTTLLLNDNNLSGEIPENKLRVLRNLRTIKVNGNPQLTGSLDEICKGGLLGYALADCNNVSCRCCDWGSSCAATENGSI